MKEPHKYVLFFLIALILLCVLYFLCKEKKTENDKFEIQIQRIIEKYDNSPITISNFEFKDTKLIFSFSEECCDHCITELFELLNDVNLLLSSDMVILASYREERKLNVFLKYHKVKSNVINVRGIRNLPFKELSLPYFFVYDPMKMEMEFFFIPRRDDKSLTLKYLEYIKSDVLTNHGKVRP